MRTDECLLAQGGDGGLNIIHAGVHIESLKIAKCFLPVFRRVAQFHVRLQPPEEVSYQYDIAASGECIGNVSHRLVHAKNFLGDHQTRSPTAWRQSEIAAEAAAAIGSIHHQRVGSWRACLFSLHREFSMAVV